MFVTVVPWWVSVAIAVGGLALLGLIWWICAVVGWVRRKRAVRKARREARAQALMRGEYRWPR